MPGMFLMDGFATDEFYSTAHGAVYDGSADFSVGVCGMIPVNAGDNEAILSCYRPTATFTGWEIRTGANWATTPPTNQVLEITWGEDAGGVPAETSAANAAPAEPQSTLVRPFFFSASVDINGNVLVYLNGILVDTQAVDVAVTAANAADAIALGHGYTNAGAVARAATNWMVNAVFLENTLVSGANMASIYNDWINTSVLNATVALDHIWYVRDAMRGGEAVGDTVANWYSRTIAAGTPKVMAATVDDGLRVRYFNDIAFGL